MRPLLGVAAERDHRGIVLLRKEFQSAGVFEWVDRVLFGEFGSQGLLERVQIRKGAARELAGAGAVEEERRSGVFDELGGTLRECPLRAGIAGFSGLVMLVRFTPQEGRIRRTACESLNSAMVAGIEGTLNLGGRSSSRG